MAAAPTSARRGAGPRPGGTIPGAAGPLALARWSPEGAPEATILALHGFGDHGRSTFARAAEAWAAAGIETLAYDQRGFGRNPSRGRWPGAEALVADLVAAARAVRAAAPCRPLAVVGHSMGGGVALAAGPTLERERLADGLVLAAPAIWGGAALNPLHRAAAWVSAAVAPDRRISGRGLVRIQASDNVEALRALARDPLYLSPPSPRELMGLVRIVDRAAAAPETRLPALMLLGEKDEILPAERVEAVFARLGDPGRVVRYEEGWHLLFRDLQAPRVWADVAGFALGLDGPCAAPPS